jgi:hypothetical protein
VEIFKRSSVRPRGHRNLRGGWLKRKFYFAHALVFVAFLSGDLDRGKLGLSSVDEIHTHRGSDVAWVAGIADLYVFVSNPLVSPGSSENYRETLGSSAQRGRQFESADCVSKIRATSVDDECLCSS